MTEKFFSCAFLCLVLTKKKDYSGTGRENKCTLCRDYRCVSKYPRGKLVKEEEEQLKGGKRASKAICKLTPYPHFCCQCLVNLFSSRPLWADNCSYALRCNYLVLPMSVAMSAVTGVIGNVCRLNFHKYKNNQRCYSTVAVSSALKSNLKSECSVGSVKGYCMVSDSGWHLSGRWVAAPGN